MAIRHLAGLGFISRCQGAAARMQCDFCEEDACNDSTELHSPIP